MKNLVELLKGREGMKLYSPICGECELIRVDTQSDFPIRVTKNGEIMYAFTFLGQYSPQEDAECLLFPSKEERSWENFQVGRVKKGEWYYLVDTRNGVEVFSYQDNRDEIDDVLFASGNYFFTKEEAEKFAKKVKRIFLERKK